ncbi:MAG: malate synthase G [Porticoccaceae bacterium]|nr:malate synthase G [Porticoccaceae bacterium]
MTSQFANTAAISDHVDIAGLRVHRALLSLVNDEVLPGTGVDEALFWRGFAALVAEFSPANRQLLARREVLQAQLDAWHRARRERPFDAGDYREFLLRIGYLADDEAPCAIATTGVDDEIARMAGPQLVVPVSNARFALNAANARWGSLYDALYGTDAIPREGGAAQAAGFDLARGRQVIARGRDFLDAHFPLADGSHHRASGFCLINGQLRVIIEGGHAVALRDPGQFRGFQGSADRPTVILLRNHGLHVEIHLNPQGAIGAIDAAGIQDIVLESALTTIMDCEDSVAAVDAVDKVGVYRNWLGLMTGKLTETVRKGGGSFERALNPDRHYQTPEGQTLILPGRSLMLVRNVGLLMTSDAVLDREGREVPEGILDAAITSLAALHDLRGDGPLRNSRAGSVYIVKPKLHGPEEVAFTSALFARVESLLGLPVNTLKLGIMDEERRTSVNLLACIRAARERVVFINTGFLDRTGDEIHTSMEAGPFAPKNSLKNRPWLEAYEKANVAAGLACGFRGRAQIGKGMWAMPDNMADMLTAKIAHPRAGANTAWVPSPTAATLHALHYHQVDVASVQGPLGAVLTRDLDAMLDIPLLREPPTAAEIQRELDNNIQGILGYVVRWVDQGIGCSKVPDIDDVALMEDRATLRISSQHVANWLRHGICGQQQVLDTLARMAAVVDGQNAGDPAYRPMAPNLADSLAFAAARDLVLKGREQPNGYTEPLLHAYRRLAKARG